MNTAPCPVCYRLVGISGEGTLYTHYRYADEAGFEPGKSHDMVKCEGSGKKP
jgi:hypothetical protein